MKLISMTYFVLLQSESIKSDIIGYGEFIDKVVKYANFIKQQLALDMFVPCDESGSVLEESLDYSDELCKYCSLDKKGNYGVDGGYMAGCEGSRCSDTREDYSLIYQQAKERVLFEFQDEYLSWDSTDMGNQTIEDLLTDEYTYILTPYALNQIGL